jgi:hypothetical protein
MRVYYVRIRTCRRTLKAISLGRGFLLGMATAPSPRSRGTYQTFATTLIATVSPTRATQSWVDWLPIRNPSEVATTSFATIFNIVTEGIAGCAHLKGLGTASYASIADGGTHGRRSG